MLERDGGAPFRGMDSAQRAELAFLRFAQRRLVRPPRARVIAPSEKRQHGKRDRNERNHAPSYHDVRAMENRTSATADGDKRRRLSALGAARQEPARYAPASRDGRASLWHAEDEDGGDALYDEASAQGCHRDGPVSPEDGGPLWVDSVEKVSKMKLWN